jgi:hypothetical protein
MMLTYDPTDANTAFLVEGSNSSYVASFGNISSSSLICMYANSQSNAGHLMGTSNNSFVIGKMDNGATSTVPDIVITDHHIGFGGVPSPAFTVDITGDLNFSGNIYCNSNALALNAWSQSPDDSFDIFTNKAVGIGTNIPLRPLHIVQGATNITQTFGEAAVINGSLAIMHGVNDSYRFVSALDNTMTSGSTRYMTFGKTIGLHQQGELSYNHVGDNNSSNYVGLGLYGGTYAAITGAGNFGVGTVAPKARIQCIGGAMIGAAFSNAMPPSEDTLLVSSYVGIGTDQPQASLHTTGDAIVQSLRAYGVISSFSDMSDIALKENFTLLQNSTRALEVLKPVEFNWKNDVFYKAYAGKRDVGLVAQNVEQVFPQIIGSLEDPNDPSKVYKTVRYEKLVPYLIQSVQELSARVRTLEKALNL